MYRKQSDSTQKFVDHIQSVVSSGVRIYNTRRITVGDRLDRCATRAVNKRVSMVVKKFGFCECEICRMARVGRRGCRWSEEEEVRTAARSAAARPAARRCCPRTAPAP